VSAEIGCYFSIHDEDGDYWDFTYDVRIFDPNGNQIAYRSAWSSNTMSFVSDLRTTLTDPDEGTYTCKIKWWVYYYELPERQATETVTYLVPTGETTIENAWSDAFPTAYKWRGRLSGGSFVGRRVQEEEGGNDVDTCHFPQSIYPPAAGLTIGDPWDVGANSEYGNDIVGWLFGPVEYYRAQGRAPCQSETDQIMKINRPGTSWPSYKTNRLKMGLSATTVWSERDGHAVSKSF
jgi:hypothetical protein